MEELPIPQLRRKAAKIKEQELDGVTKKYYNHNFDNCMLWCTHKTKFNYNVYIPGIIQTGLCYMMMLVILLGFKPSNPTVNIFNSQEKAYQEDKDSWKNSDMKIM